MAAGAGPAVMRVDALGVGSGTGFQVDRKGHVVTNGMVGRQTDDGSGRAGARLPGRAARGCPLTATQGIVSGTGRDPDSSSYQYMVQFDAAINPGNSGGPVLGLDGKVVAVATALTEEKQNMNYGVLGANARDVVKRLVD